jgi:stearoyl-CoA desaturase (delta-9 desaturase)
MTPVETAEPKKLTIRTTPSQLTDIPAASSPRARTEIRMGRAAQKGQLNVITAFFMAVFHIGAIAALFFFSWQNLLVAAVLYFFSINMGIGMGYHRLLTHRGYRVPKWLEYFLAVCGTLALEGGPVFWVATHRVHHQHSDHEGDPHTPHDGTYWAHVGWIISGRAMHSETALLGRYAPDLTRDRFYVWLSKYHWVPLTTVGLLLLAVGGWSMVLWGIFLRVTLGLHATWLVNSATHLWGQRRFETRDDSRNNWWVALLTGGEGWHNNHHAHPVSARHGLAWYEFDPNYYGIWLLEKIGLAKKVQVAQFDPQNPRPAGM